jgi:hypothetical protein
LCEALGELQSCQSFGGRFGPNSTDLAGLSTYPPYSIFQERYNPQVRIVTQTCRISCLVGVCRCKSSYATCFAKFDLPEGISHQVDMIRILRIVTQTARNETTMRCWWWLAYLDVMRCCLTLYNTKYGENAMNRQLRNYSANFDLPKNIQSSYRNEMCITLPGVNWVSTGLLYVRIWWNGKIGDISWQEVNWVALRIV